MITIKEEKLKKDKSGKESKGMTRTVKTEELQFKKGKK